MNWAYFSLDDRLVGFAYTSTGPQRQELNLSRQPDAGDLQIDTLQQGGDNDVLAWRHGANGYYVLRQEVIEQDFNGKTFRPAPDDGGLIDLLATTDRCVIASTPTGLYSRDPNGVRPWVLIGKRPEGVDLDAGALRSGDLLLAGLTLDGGVTLIDYSDRTGTDACNLNSLGATFTCSGCPGGLTVVDHRPTRSPLGVVITCRPVSGPSRFFFISKSGPLCDRSELLDGRGYFADTSGFLHESVFGGVPNAWGKASGSGQLYFGSSQLDPQPLYLDGPPALIIAQADGGIDAYDDRSHARVANGALREPLAAGDARRARVAIGGRAGWALNAHGQVVDLAGDPDAPLCTVDPAAPALEEPLHATAFSDDAGVGVLVSDRTRMFFGHVGASERLEPRVLPNLASAVQAIEPVPGEPAGIFYVATAQTVVRVDVRAVQWQVSAVPVPPGDLASLWQADGKVRALYRDGRVVSLPSGLTLAGAAGDGRQFLEAVEACGHVLASTSRGLAALGPAGWQPQLADGLTGDAAARIYRAGDTVFEARRDGQLAQSSRLCP
ncbi:MAG: hypothetical protein IPJ65_27965 [Archangiaceae bacterium]|nr:hypothetical protein [Archangiaceae bacterium]